VLVVLFRTMDSLRIFDVIYATTLGGPNDATTNLHIMAYQYSFQWYQMGKGMAQAIVLLLLVVIVSYLLMRLWNRPRRARYDVAALPSAGPTASASGRTCAGRGRAGGASCCSLWTVFPFLWILLTSLKSPGDIISVPPTFVFTPTLDNYAALVMGEQRGSTPRPARLPAVLPQQLIHLARRGALSVVAGIPAAYALRAFAFPFKNGLAFVLMSFRFVPFIAFVIPLYLLYQRSACTTRMPA
jgi:ABC-type glycerol-3-phosphate transport system permease component